jgi:3-oxoacyl-[acyl-carrier protein] reductase
MGQVAGIELASRDVTFNTIAVGWLEEEDYSSAMLDAIPARRLMKHSELGEIIEFLVSPSASYINGTTLVVDGGFSVSKVPGGSPLLT